MTAPRLSTYVRLALVAAAVGNLSACVATGGYYEPAPYYASPGYYYGDYYGDYYDYWYYPAIGGYYDPRARLYMYYEHDHWIRSHALPPHYRPYLGSHVTIHSRHDRPYEDHYKHRERYAPERYKSERYRHTPSDRKDNDIWIGAPRRPTPDRDRDDRRPDNSNRDNGNRNNGDRNRNDRDQSRDFDRNRGSDRRAAPVQQQNTERMREARTENSRDRYRDSDIRRGNDQNRGASSIQPQYRERAPAAQQPPAKTQPRKDEKQRDDKRNKNDAGSQTPQPGPYDRYNNFR